jgi:hypothetical protein
MRLDVRCSSHHLEDPDIGCQLYVGHEREHASVCSDGTELFLHLWTAHGHVEVPFTTATLPRQMPWAPGCPAVEALPLAVA